MSQPGILAVSFCHQCCLRPDASEAYLLMHELEIAAYDMLIDEDEEPEVAPDPKEFEALLLHRSAKRRADRAVRLFIRVAHRSRTLVQAKHA
jgi:hypothetical protein